MTESLQGFRLSPQQRRLWRLREAGSACRVRCALRLDGALDAERLAQALRRVAARHEILRTTFARVPGISLPVQQIRERPAWSLERGDLSDLAAAERDAEIARRLDAGLAGEDELVPRAALLALGEVCHALVLDLSALAADAWSLRLAAREIAAVYAGAAPPGDSDEEVLQYADASEWQNELLEGAEAAEAAAYWQARAEELPAATRYPFDGTATWEAAGRDAPWAAAFAVEAAARDCLERLAGELEAPLAAVVAAAWGLLLARLAGDEAVAFGRSADGRRHQELRAGVGPFARRLPLAVRVDLGESFRALAARVAASVREGDGWQELFDGSGLDAVERAIGFTWEERPEETVAGGLRFVWLGQRRRVEPFALELVARRDPSGAGALAGELRFDPGRVGEAAAGRLAEEWRTLLADAARRPDAECGALAILGPEERALATSGRAPGGSPAGDPAADLPLDRLVERQATATPDTIALETAAGAVSYGELERRAASLAALPALRALAPETPVALALERSPAMVVALLGTWKAGGAALPLDLQAPPERLARTLADAGARVLVASAREPRELPRFAGEVVRLGAGAPVAREAPRHPAPEAPSRLAYLVYTSGTTGEPKGVLGTHGGAASYLRFVVDEYGVGPATTVLQVAALAFDASLRDLVAPLTAGARVVLPREDEARDPRALLACARRHRSDAVLAMVPTLLRAVAASADDGEGAACPLRVLVLSGEPLTRADAGHARRLFGEDVLVVNQYGPTECTMTSSFHYLAPAARGEDGTPVPIGRPIPGARFYAVDARGEPLPVGVAGELWIGGPGVTRGYRGRPKETAARFVPDPFGGVGERLYRTGDLGRRHADGEMELLGRLDRQVKVRGVRVELDEVEGLLAACPGVREAAVVARPAAAGTTLAAYVARVGRRGAEAQAACAAQLREFLRRRLPEAMVPAWFVELPSLPRTRTGKLDRAALPDPEQARARARGGRPERALTPIESQLALIWSEVLGVEAIGPDDSFFELGGHSLLAARLTARVQQAFGVELPLRTLFEASTVTALAARVAAAAGDSRRPAPPLEAAPRGGPVPVSFAQQRLWFLQRLDPGTPAFNVSRGLRLRGSLAPAVLARAIGEITRRHEALRTRFVEIEGAPFQVVSPPRPVALPVVDLSGLPLAEARRLEAERRVAAAGRTPFDLGAGPLLRTSLVRLGGEEHLLLFDTHHIVSDNWSMGVLVDELSALYAAFSRGEGSPLPPLPVQYADYAVWQRRWLRGETLEERLAYWRRRLGTPPPVLELPVARAPESRPAEPGYGGGRASFLWPVSRLQALRSLGREEGATLFMVVLAAFQALLHRYTGEEDVTVGTDVANRGRVEIEGLIGFFVNLLVLRTDLGGDPTFRELLGRAREIALGAFTHQDLPFERLVEELQPERTAGRAPLFRHLLVLQDPGRRQLELPGLEIAPLPVDNRTSKFDLALILVETADGLAGTWNYSTDLFDEAGIATLTRHFETFLDHVVARPDDRLSRLDHLDQSEREQAVMDKKQRKQADFAKFMNLQPTAVEVSRGRLVSLEPLVPGGTLPLVARPAGEEVSLADWAAAHRELVEEKLAVHGAILFRGFDLAGAAEFEQVARAISPELYAEYGDLPRDSVSGDVYTSTPYPPSHTIWFHNESSQLDSWPRKQYFFCVQPAAAGGETPIVDCREVYRRLDPEVRDRFERLGVMYVRNFTEGLDVDWLEFFRTDDRAEVEAWCRRSAIECNWKPDGGLRTRKVCPAVIRHPKTGEMVFFNQIQAHHVACLPEEERRSLLDLFAVEDLPRNAYYGDGSPIEDALMKELVALYSELAVTFDWREGDVILVDNMLTAHGRYPFEGARKILVAMGEMVSIDAVWSPERRLAAVGGPRS